MLSDEERKQLEQGYKASDHHCLRQRCKMVLLKAEGYTSKQVATILDTNEISVHNWLKRYAAEGLKGYKPEKDRAENLFWSKHTSVLSEQPSNKNDSA